MIIRRARYLLLALTLGMALVGCASKKPIGYSDFDAETDFSSYKTFAWISLNPLYVSSANPANPALQGIIQDEVKANLSGRGFRYVGNPKQADFVIGFTVGSQETMRTSVYSQTYKSSWKVGGYAYTQIGVFNQDSTEGGLVIDVFDQAKAEKKWMGWAIQELSMNDRIYLQDTVHELVTIILGHFPPT
jgi:hypothetical protein